MLEAVFSNVIVQKLEQEEKQFGHIIVPNVGNEKGLRGIITSVGPGSHSLTGEFIKTTLKEGQEVVLPPIGPVKLEHDGKEYYSINEQQIIAIIK